MFREKMIEWGRFLSPSIETLSLVRRLGKQPLAMSRKERKSEEYRAQFNLDVSRAYIKLAQLPR
jgi:hypothetical protein